MSDNFGLSDFDRRKVEAILKETRSDQWHERAVWPFRFAKKIMEWYERRNTEEIRRIRESLASRDEELSEERSKRREAQREAEALKDQRNRYGMAIRTALSGRMPPDDFGIRSAFEHIVSDTNACRTYKERCTALEIQLKQAGITPRD